MRLGLASSVLGACAFVLAAAIPAHAATVSDVVTFSANNFNSAFGSPVPVSTVTGSFTITFDPTQNYSDTTSGITLDSLNITLGSALSFNYASSTGLLEVGGINDGTCCISYSPPSNDFWLYISDFNTSPSFFQLGYTQGEDDYYYTFQGSEYGSVTVAPAATPLPATLPLFAGGLGAMGLFGWRRKRKNAAALAAA